MHFTYTITTIKCQSCTGKTHCAACGAEAEETLRRSPAIEEITIDLSQKTAHVTGGDEDAILNALDDAGLLVN